MELSPFLSLNFCSLLTHIKGTRHTPFIGVLSQLLLLFLLVEENPKEPHQLDFMYKGRTPNPSKTRKPKTCWPKTRLAPNNLNDSSHKNFNVPEPLGLILTAFEAYFRVSNVS
jgi:hypothetical protein